MYELSWFVTFSRTPCAAHHLRVREIDRQLVEVVEKRESLLTGRYLTQSPVGGLDLGAQNLLGLEVAHHRVRHHPPRSSHDIPGAVRSVPGTRTMTGVTKPGSDPNRNTGTDKVPHCVPTIVARAYDDRVVEKARLSVSVDEELAEAGRRAVSEGRAESVSGWVSDALRRQADHDDRMRALDDLIGSYEADHGEITCDEVAAAVRSARGQAVVKRGAA